MYNYERKTEFLLTLDQNGLLRFSNIFELTEPLEDKYDEDVCNMPYDIIMQHIMKAGSYSNYTSFYDRFLQIKKYKTWSLKNGYIKDDAKAYVDEKCNLKTIFIKYNKITLYRTPKEFACMLKTCMRDTCVYEEELSFDDMLTAYCMLIYQGFTSNETLSLKLENVISTQNKLVILNKHAAAVIYPEFKDAVLRVYNIRKMRRIIGKVEHVSSLNDYLINTDDCTDLDKRKRRMSSGLLSRSMNMKMGDIYYTGKLYDYFAHKDSSKEYKRHEIVEFCFGANNKLSKRKREQFYRFYELWEK